MLEIKVTIEAPELSAAINNLVKAFESGICVNPHTDVGPVIPAGTQASKTQTGESLAPPIQEQVQPMQSTPSTNVPAPKPTEVMSEPAVEPPVAEKKYTLEDLSNAGARLVDAGKMPQIMQLINKYGVQAINQLNPAVYGEFAKDLMALGAKL